jgi:hypothetical protein
MTPLHRCAAVAIPFFCIVVAAAPAPGHEAACPLRGVWELTAVSNNGKDQPRNGAKQWKIVTQSHWMWVSADARRDTLPLKTEADTLRRFLIGGGAGTYTASGDSYVEQIEIFNDPAWLGKPWKSTCHVVGNLWHQSYPFPQDSTGVSRDSISHIVETWRKVE